MQKSNHKKLAPVGVWYLPAKKQNASFTSNLPRYAK